MDFLNVDQQRPDAELDIVGEHAYQPALELASGGLGPDGPAIRDQTALLILEPDNPYDGNAVAIHLMRQDGDRVKVGYLAQHIAIAYSPVLELTAPLGIRCRAFLKGGFPLAGSGHANLGVVLRVGSAGELAAEVWLRASRLRTDHPWAAKAVAFTGESLFAIGPVRLDRMGQRYLADRAGCRSSPACDQAG